MNDYEREQYNIQKLNRLMLPLNFPANRFKISLTNNGQDWTVFENSKPLATFGTYEEAENCWATYCRTIAIKSLSYIDSEDK
jgi:hypothetical protein